MSTVGSGSVRRIVKGLGEIALRASNLDRMREFYEQVIGLEVLNSSDDAVFFKVAGGYGGHTQVMVLFDRSKQPGYSRIDAAKSTLDHIAFEIDQADFEEGKRRLEGMGLTPTVAEHKWAHWKSLYVKDPEGNEVELVCYDQDV